MATARVVDNLKGQALLLVLLSMAVVLTIVLSILSRSVTDVAVTSREEEALRAFSAAEAGFEQALIIGSDIGNTNIGDASYTAQVTEIATGLQEFIYPTSLLSGESVVVWFVSHSVNGDLICDSGQGLGCYTGEEMNICWGQSGTPVNQATTPAIELSIFYTDPPGDYSGVNVARVTVDPNVTRASNTNFDTPDSGTCTIDGQEFAFTKRVRFSTLGIAGNVRNQENGLQFARMKLLYNTDIPHAVGVIVAGGVLPSQGKRVESTGAAGEATRRIEVFQTFPEPPPIFDSGIFTLGDLIK